MPETQGSCLKCQAHGIFKLRAHGNVAGLRRGKDLNPELLNHTVAPKSQHFLKVPAGLLRGNRGQDSPRFAVSTPQLHFYLFSVLGFHLGKGLLCLSVKSNTCQALRCVVWQLRARSHPSPRGCFWQWVDKPAGRGPPGRGCRLLQATVSSPSRSRCVVASAREHS